MTSKEIEKILTKTSYLEIVKINTKQKSRFLVYNGKKNQHNRTMFMFYDGTDWVYERGNCYLYRADGGRHPLSVYHDRMKIDDIKVFDPVSFIAFLNKFLHYFQNDQFFKFLTN